MSIFSSLFDSCKVVGNCFIHVALNEVKGRTEREREGGEEKRVYIFFLFNVLKKGPKRKKKTLKKQSHICVFYLSNHKPDSFNLLAIVSSPRSLLKDDIQVVEYTRI